MVGCFLDKSFDIAATHDRDDDVGLTVNFSHVEDGDDVWVVTEFTHGPGFPGDAFPSVFIEVFGFDKGKGGVPVEDIIMNEVDLLLTALAEFSNYLVAAVDEGGGFDCGWFGGNGWFL